MTGFEEERRATRAPMVKRALMEILSIPVNWGFSGYVLTVFLNDDRPVPVRH
jgi:hypothetical protein